MAGATAGLAAPFLSRPAKAADVTWRLGHSAPADFALHIRLVEAAGAIAAGSKGKMLLQVYPNSELGGPVGLMGQLSAGTLDAAPLTNQLLSSNLAFAALPMMGFAFPGYEQVWGALDGDLGTLLRKQIKDRLGLTAMTRAWNFGFRQVTTSTKPIKTADDLGGVRLRTPPEADLIGLFQALKAVPLAMPLTGLEKALVAHTIDGQEGVLPLVSVAGLWRAQSFCALTNHVWDGHWICVSGKSWTALPAALKDVVTAAFDEAALHQREDTISNETRLQKELEAKGLKFNTTDSASFRKMLRQAGYYAAWQKRLGDDSWSALEKYAGRLA